MMTLKKAIEIVNDWGVISKPQVDQDLLDACKLLVENGKRTLRNRKCEPEISPTLLPGEAPE